MRSLKTLATTGLLALAISPAAQAADLFSMPTQAPAVVSDPVELGTGWYLRGDAGWMSTNTAQLSTDILTSKKSHSWNVDIGAGYQFNNWFRTDLTVGFNKLQNENAAGRTVTCPYQLTGVTSQDGATEYGYLWDPVHDTCGPQESVSMRRIDTLLNGYFDLGNYAGVTPYIGAGIGVSSLHTQGALNYYKTSDGSVYGADLTPTGTFPHQWVDGSGIPISPQPRVPFAQQNWARNIHDSKYNFAWALMAGFAYDISDHAKLDVGYRYLNAGKYTSAPSPTTGATSTRTLSSQEVRVGLRYMID